MRKTIFIILISSFILLSTGCTTLTLRKGDAQATYRSIELFRTRSTHAEYDPATQAFVVDVKREQAISPELMQAAAQAGAVIAQAAATGAK